MANNVIDWAYLFYEVLAPLEKFVLVTIANDATRVGTCFYLGSVRNIGKECNLSERHVRRILRRLEGYGLLKTYPQVRETGKTSTNTYQVSLMVNPAEWSQSRKGKAASRTAIMSTWDEKAFQAALEAKIDTQTLNTWIRACQVVTVEKKRIIFRVPMPSFADKLLDFKKSILESVNEQRPGIDNLHFIIEKKL